MLCEAQAVQLCRSGNPSIPYDDSQSYQFSSSALFSAYRVGRKRGNEHAIIRSSVTRIDAAAASGSGIRHSADGRIWPRAVYPVAESGANGQNKDEWFSDSSLLAFMAITGRRKNGPAKKENRCDKIDKCPIF
jgi:hypothetical protein